MLDESHYDLLVKYESDELDFNPEELARLCGILNLSVTTFEKDRLAEYRTLINQAMEDQNRIMTEIGGEYLTRAHAGLELEGFRYVVENITRISSPYMLNILVGLLSHKTKHQG
jgi:hypothetical protein